MSAAVLPSGVDACGDPLEVVLLAGQNLDAGSVTIANDETTLYVTYVTRNGWTIGATHLEVTASLDAVPTNSKGNPIVGRFTFEGTHDGTTTVSYAIPLADLGVDAGDELIVAAHAEVENSDLHKKEAAWADGTLFTDGSWATYVSYTLQTCAIVLAPTELCSEHDAEDIVTFADPNLEAAVRNAMHVGPEGAITCGQAARLKSLFADDRGISDLTGSQNLSGLTFLHLGGNAVSDLGPLSQLASLEKLLLPDNSITSVSPLSGLTSLTFLNLNSNTISDISPLSGLTDLETLQLGGNSIGDLGPLSGLTGLGHLTLFNNAITDLGPLRGLTSLTFLGVSGNSITDLSPLSGLADLTLLQIGSNEITDLGPLSGLTALEVLDLGGNNVTDLGPLTGLRNLGTLILAGNQHLSDIQPLLDNTGLGSGDSVDLRSTSVACADVAALEAKGVTVFSDCP